LCGLHRRTPTSLLGCVSPLASDVPFPRVCLEKFELVQFERFRRLEAVRVLTDRLEFLAYENDLPVTTSATLRNLSGLPPAPERLASDIEFPMNVYSGK